MSNELKGIIEDNSLEILVEMKDAGPRGEQGDDGYTPIKGVDYFDGKDGEQGIQGIPGETGKSIEYTWNGTQLGVRIEGETNYTYVNLKGDKGDKGDPGEVDYTKLELKADKTYVDNKVKTDVPENAVFTDTIVDISGKADISSLDSKLDASGGTLKNYKEEKALVSEEGVIDLSQANIFIDSPIGNRDYSIINASPDVAHSFTLVINVDFSIPTLTFPNSVKWQGGEIPDMSTANKTYVLTFMTVDGGATWLGMSSGKFEGKYKIASDDDFSGTSNGEFKYIGSHEYVIIPHVIKGVNVTSYKDMFRDNLSTTLKGVASDNLNITNMGYMFYNSQATTLDLSSFDTSKVTNMSWMFYNSQATTLDLSSFDTSNVTNMTSMFRNSAATTLDLSSFDTSSVTNMSYMFENSQATTLDLSSFDTSNVTDMTSMFRNSAATTLDLSSFDTSSVTNMSYMFENSQATTLDLSSFDTSNVTNMTEMFRGSKATTGYARTQADADRFNASSGKPAGLTFVVK